ncbi:hypothetical protein Lal_00025001, partial [Lupinus albus]
TVTISSYFSSSPCCMFRAESTNNAIGGNEPKKVKVLNTSSLQISENDASSLVGSIVEKGLSDSHNNNNSFLFYPFPKLNVLHFPIARHRSHGPNFTRLNSLSFDFLNSLCSVDAYIATYGMFLNLIHYNKPPTSESCEQLDGKK